MKTRTLGVEPPGNPPQCPRIKPVSLHTKGKHPEVHLPLVARLSVKTRTLGLEPPKMTHNAPGLSQYHSIPRGKHPGGIIAIRASAPRMIGILYRT